MDVYSDIQPKNSYVYIVLAGRHLPRNLKQTRLQQFARAARYFGKGTDSRLFSHLSDARLVSCGLVSINNELHAILCEYKMLEILSESWSLIIEVSAILDQFSIKATVDSGDGGCRRDSKRVTIWRCLRNRE